MMKCAILSVFGLLLVLANLCTSFNCHTCIAWECEADFDEAHCEEMAQIVWESMGNYRQVRGHNDMSHHMIICPEVNNTASWTSISSFMEKRGWNTCKHDGWALADQQSYCGKTGFYTVVQKSKFSREMAMYGTVMGCTSWYWLKKNCAEGKCVKNFCGSARTVHQSSQKFGFQEFAIHYHTCVPGSANCTNCRDCGEASYCAGPEDSIVTRPNIQKGGLSALTWVMIGALLLMAVIAGICCYEPKRRQLVHGTFVFDEDLMGVVRKT